MKKIRKGDQVVVLSGRNKGRRGAVLQVLADGRVVVESVNMVKKHQKPNPQAGKQGGIIEKEMPLPVSKVAIWNPGAKRGDRVGIKTLGDGKRVRFFKSNGEMLDSPAAIRPGAAAPVLPRAGRAADAHRAADREPHAGAAHQQDHGQHGRRGSGGG